MSIDKLASGADLARRNYEHIFGATQEQAAKASATMLKAYEDLSKFSRESLDAYVAAGTALARGFETIGKSWIQLTHENFEASARTTKALLGAKTLSEAFDAQTDFAKTTFDKLIAEGTKVSELAVKVTNEAAEPISTRLNAAIGKLIKPIAA
jgi:phasin family protein